MANDIYRSQQINTVTHAISAANTAIAVNHPGLTGEIRELAAVRIFQPVIPSGYEIGTGKICDRHGQLSSQVDIIVYHAGILPPVIFHESRSTGVFPIEAVYYAIEVKSILSARELQSVVANGQEILKLDHDYKKHETSRNRSIVVPALFAFGTDLAKQADSVQYMLQELRRYAAYDPDWQTDPVVKAFCIVGRGYFYFDYVNLVWELHTPTQDFDEVLDLVGHMANTLSANPFYSRRAQLGNYLQLGREVHSFNAKQNKKPDQ